jgi:hypothetical protein
MICENHIWETLPDGSRICFECDQREAPLWMTAESEVLGHTTVPYRIDSFNHNEIEASIHIKTFAGDCPTVGEHCTLEDGEEGVSLWIIKKVEILDDCLELTLKKP